MILFAIRHNPSGHFIPWVRLHGGSRVEPLANCIPRLFTERRTAKGWLTTWLKGKLIQVSTGREIYEGYPDFKLTLIPVPSRKRDEMEIVAVELRLHQ